MVAIIKTTDNGSISVRLAASATEARKIILDEWFRGDAEWMEECRRTNILWEDLDNGYTMEIAGIVHNLDD